MKLYQVEATREDGWWIATVPELPGVFTHARRLAQVDDLIKDAIALWLEVAAEDLAVVVTAEVGGLHKEIVEAITCRARATEAQHQANYLMINVAQKLAEQGITVRDIGTMLGVSYQRAHQLVGPAASAGADDASSAPARKKRVVRKAVVKHPAKKATKRIAARERP